MGDAIGSSMHTQAMSDHPYFGRTLHFGNLGLSFGSIAIGALLALLGPVLDVHFKYKNLEIPDVVVLIVGIIFALLGLLVLVVAEKTIGTCKRCSKTLTEGEAAFPPDADAYVRGAVRAGDPRPLFQVPVGSRFDAGPHFDFHYCGTCKQVGRLSMRAATGGYEFKERAIFGEPAAHFAQICEQHQRVRDANNAQAGT